MTTRTCSHALLAMLAAGSALALAGACGGIGGSDDGRAFQHASKFVVTGSHQGLTCDACHAPAAPSFAIAGGGMTCLGCHLEPDVSPGHAAVAGYAWDDASCVACHRDGKTAQFDHSKDFPIADGTPHQRLACTDCHGPTRAVADLRCITCHTHADQAALATTHAAVVGYAYDSPSCYRCHQDGTAGLPPDHDARLFLLTGTKHQGIGCAQCHGPTKQVADLSCVPCHEKAKMDAKHASIPASTTGRSKGTTGGIARPSYQYLSTACVRCHADGEKYPISSHPSFQGKQLKTSGDHRPFCLTCHQASRGDRSWAANFKAYTCLDCHSSNNPD